MAVRGPRGAFAAQAKNDRHRHCGADDDWGDIFSPILAERVDPHLGVGRATLLYEYPLPLAALARAKPGSDKVAERFELYACGVELANAFGELTDAAEQRARFKVAMDEKQRIHGERYPVDEDFLAALWRQCRRHPVSPWLRPPGENAWAQWRATHRTGNMDADNPAREE